MSQEPPIWTTEDPEIDYGLYEGVRNAVIMQQPLLRDSWSEIAKIKGVVVQSTSTTKIMGSEIKSSEKLLEVRKEKIPGSAFEVPGDYQPPEV